MTSVRRVTTVSRSPGTSMLCLASLVSRLWVGKEEGVDMLGVAPGQVGGHLLDDEANVCPWDSGTQELHDAAQCCSGGLSHPLVYL